MPSDASTHRRIRLGTWMTLLLLLTSCGSTAPPAGTRPTLSAAGTAGYREFADDQEKEIREGPGAESDTRLTEEPRLRDFLAMAFARNPRILRARSEWKASLERVPQVTALPDPTLSVLHYAESVETRTGPMENVFTFAQRIPYPGKLSDAGDVAAQDARIAELRYSAMVRDVLVETKVAYYEFVYLFRAKLLVEQNVGIANRLAALGSELYTEDRALFIDVLKAQSQLAQLQYDLITLAELVSAERTRLNALLDRPPEASIGTPAGPPFPRIDAPVEELFEIAAKNREELRISDRLIDRARAREDLAESQYVPDFSVGLNYVQVGESRVPQPDGGKDAWGVSLGVTIPIWFNRITAGVREARAEREAAIRGKASVWNETFSAVKDAYFRLTNAERLVLLYRDSLIPQARQVMISTEELARQDRKRLGDYLEAQTVWLNFTLAMERALTDYNQSIARIERLTGASLVAAEGEEGR